MPCRNEKISSSSSIFILYDICWAKMCIVVHIFRLVSEFLGHVTKREKNARDGIYVSPFVLSVYVHHSTNAIG